MPDNARVLQLLSDALDSDRTPDEVCAEWPELLAEVRLRWEECQRVKGEIDELFPPSDALAGFDPALARYRTHHVPQIAGYEIGSTLGHGGVGVVYRAHHLGLNRTIALKMLLSGAYAGPIELARFLREARAVAGLKHPNIVQVYDVGAFDGRPFYTMELVDGGTLADKLANRPQPFGEAAAMLVTLADAVEAAHRGGIVHRDLKPSNILLTPEGVPKISDFGLARSSDGDDALTIGNAGVGTPSYMAPEQVTGSPNAIGPAGDVYSLGVILYEMLTGRPPFHGESATETRRQLLADEPVPPSRLNTRVPRDLETICLKCLQKDPRRRYATAAELADDVRRFQRHEPILARSAGRAERVVKWIRRHPTATTACASMAVIALAIVAAALWMASGNAAMTRAAEMDLREAIDHQRQSNWPAADGALERAALRLQDGGGADLRDRLAKARQDSELVVRLDKIRLDGAISVGGEMGIHPAVAGAAYAAAFRDAGLGRAGGDAEVVAKRLLESPVSDALLAALDDWAFTARVAKDDPWLMSLVRRVHTNPDGTTDELLPLALRADPDECNAYVANRPLTRRALPLLLATTAQVPGAREAAIPMLTKLQQAFPTDFWTNELLGSTLDNSGKPEESLRYLQTALSIRPDVAITHNNLGRALHRAGKNAEALPYFKKAIELDPSAAQTHGNLAAILVELGEIETAQKEVELAIRLGPDSPFYRITLAGCFLTQNRIDEAIDEMRRTIALEPKFTPSQDALRSLLRRQNRHDDAVTAWQKAIAVIPDDHDARDGYAEYCLYLGRTEDYERARAELLERFGDSTEAPVCERTGRACLLLPPSSPAQLQRATAAIDRAVAIALDSPSVRGSLPYYRFAKGLAEYRSGSMDAAFSLAQESSGVLQPAPQLVAAMAEFRLGREREARDRLAAAIASRDWGPASADGTDAREVWIYHLLRREAEALILPAR
jgi:eukaryotic-like serine/threonine-protein kinase